jgi:hypothetical protein
MLRTKNCHEHVMKLIYYVLFTGCFSCNAPEKPENAATTADTAAIEHVTDRVKKSLVKSYSNARFKDVVVEQSDSGRFHISGKAQVFEAVFSWVVEDGQEELLSGHEMTDAGAPAFGNFSFDIAVKKKVNTALYLVLFESSPKDGSRQFELRVPLY